jgi:hypothetical protein
MIWQNVINRPPCRAKRSDQPAYWCNKNPQYHPWRAAELVRPFCGTACG